VKVCKDCRETKEATHFSSHPSTKDRLAIACKPCQRARSAAWYQKNRERVLERTAQWGRDNIEKRREIGRKSNRATISTRRAWYTANPDKVRAIARVTRAKNIEKCRARVRVNTKRYRAQRLRKPARWACLKAIAAIYAQAAARSLETGIPHDVDHIVPVRGKGVCGLHCESNLQILPASENRVKGNRFWPDMF
jgi:hypothetical protein